MQNRLERVESGVYPQEKNRSLLKRLSEASGELGLSVWVVGSGIGVSRLYVKCQMVDILRFAGNMRLSFQWNMPLVAFAFVFYNTLKK